MEIDEKLDNIEKGLETTSERQFGQKFKELYTKARNGLVVLEKARKNVYKDGKREKNAKGKLTITKGQLVKPAEITNEEAYNKAIEFIQSLID